MGRLKEQLTQTRTCSIALSDKDKEDLADMGFLDDTGPQQLKSDVEVLPMVRLATIDGFQGEEAKVIILSTVRSNLQDRVGFLQTINRINVACSRARNGFYIVGNSTLLRSVDMWKSIIADFESKGRIGKSFTTHCSRHPHLVHAVSQPRQFQELTLCSKACNHKFGCGHKCPEKCHEPGLHSRMRCEQPCNKSHPQCGHKCTNICGGPCGDCSQIVSVDSLPCGHTYLVQCADVGQEKARLCTVSLGPTTLPCGHSLERVCSSKDEPAVCKAQCQFIHPCGHRCGGECHECQENHFHRKCQVMCGKQLPCGHVCSDKCHPGPCPQCEQPCIRSCEHGKVCPKPCYVECDPCVKGCLKTSCPHGSCSTICSLPCGRLPCSEPCPLPLPCSHICPGLCGEQCATVCVQCQTGQVPQKAKIFLPCGHESNVEELDFLFGLANLFHLSSCGEILSMKRSMADACKGALQCPRCGASCGNVHRYRHLRQFEFAPNTIERLYKMFGRKMDMFAHNIREKIEDLDRGFEGFCKGIDLGPLAGQQSSQLIKGRVLYLMSTQTAITQFRGEPAAAR